LLFAVRQGAGLPLRLITELHGLERMEDAVAVLARVALAERGEHALRGAAKGQLDVVPYGEVHEHRRRLELPADAELGDLVLAKREKVRVVAEDHAAALGLHASGDDVAQGRLARAVRPMTTRSSRRSMKKFSRLSALKPS